MNKAVIAIIVLVVLIGGFTLMKGGSSTPVDTTPTASTPTASTGKVVDIAYENGAWNPATVTVAVGDTVRITNKHTANIRAASGPHPFHTSQPDFDSDTLAPGESYSYATKAIGKIDYHNHFNPGVLGEIIIK